MNRFIHILCAAAMLFFASACNEEKFVVDSTTVEEGLPATISLRINVPQSTNIANSRAVDDIEAEIQELMIIMFENTSNRKEVIDLTGNLEKSASNALGEGSACYVNTNAIKTLSGRYRAYFIANWQSPFSTQTKDYLTGLSESALKEVVLNNPEITTGSLAGQHASQLIGQYRLPMTFFSKEITILPDENGQANPANIIGDASHGSSSVLMRRGTARIEFNIKNGNNCTFTPTNIAVYNVPAAAPMFDQAHLTGTQRSEYLTRDHFTIPTQAVINGEFSFLMLESLPGDPKGTINNWGDREAWDETTQNSNPATREFTNAPDNAPYVVINGTYSDNQGSGNTRYFIHLGNFSSTGSNDNFNVRRNERQIYTITVTGINSIKAEVKVEGGSKDNPGAEGNVVMLTNANTVKMDSHYGQVMLRINKNSFNSSDETTADASAAIIISSPKTGNNSQTYAINKLGQFCVANIDENGKVTAGANIIDNSSIDYKWVQFQKPTNANTFPTYAGVGSKDLGYINNLFIDPESYCLEVDDYYYTVAWVDENVYSDLALSQYAGEKIPDRLFIFEPNPVHRSADGQSTVVQSFSFAIEQKPIFSPFDLSSNYENPFGYESEEEMSQPVFLANGSFNATSKTKPNDKGQNPGTAVITNSGLDWVGNAPTTKDLSKQLTGWQNTIDIFSGQDMTALSDYGYFYDSASNTYTLHQSMITNTLNALKARNRDLDGNGTLDSDEIRWYMPTYTQYCIFWVARLNINTPLRLFPLTTRTGVDDFNIPRYFCTGSENLAVFWQDQGASGTWGQLSAVWFQPKQCVRFVRNLKTINGSISRLAATHNAETQTIILNSPEITRNWTRTTLYPFMYQNTATEEVTKLPSALQYKTTLINLSKTNSDGDMVYFKPENNENTTGANSMVSLIQSIDPNAFNDGWRIPNQNELILLMNNGVFNSYQNSGSSDQNGTINTASTNIAIPAYTWCSQSTRYCFFIFIGADGDSRIISTYPNGTGSVSGNPGTTTRFYAILVRDYIPTATASNDGSFTGGGGSAIK